MHRNVRQWPAAMRAVAELIGTERQAAGRSVTGERIAAAIASGVPTGAAVMQAMIANAPLGPQPEIPMKDDKETVDESIYGDEFGNLPGDTGLYDPNIHGELEEEDL
jgi:hypothetical protein